MPACPVCGRESPSDARFCAACGAALTAPAAPKEERKVVSVVFVDLVGHTARSESADPEDVRATLAPYHARARDVLERFGGTVEKFIGDAVMAVFGAPVAHEDDPERAVRAALGVRDALVEDGLDVRAAVHTGEALVSLGADAAEGEALVAGDVVNTAARLQSAAPVNGVLVGAVTHRTTERVIEYRAADAVAAKGKSEPVEAWEAVAPRARLGVDVSHHGAADLVGRELELRALSDALERARAGAMQLVTLVASPGMGKSRLVWELLRQIESELEFTHWRQGRALAYGGGAFGAVAEAARAQIGMLESDAPSDVEQKLGAALDALPIVAGERGWLEARIRPLVGLESEQSTREESFVAWRRLFEAIAEVFPLVLVLEDLHWADDGTLEFVEHLLDWSADTPLLVVCTARPELLERRPTWGGGRLNSNTVALSPLPDEATARLLAHLLDRPVLAADVQARLLQQAGGNPLYAEEYARMLEQGQGDSLPDTVQGVIAARLDRLETDEKELLQAAAVLGKVFWADGVAALGAAGALDERLQRLVRKEFLRRERSSSMSGEVEYAFRHALVRDVAYAQLPRAVRAEKHQLAAEWIAEVAAHRPELVAHHYAEALALIDAAGGSRRDVEKPARAAFRAAGEQARSLGALDDVQAHFRRALALHPPLAEFADLQVLLADALVDSDPAATRDAALAAREAYTELGDFAGVARAEALVSSAHWGLGDGQARWRHLDAAIAAATASGSSRALALVRTQHARALAVSGQFDEAIPVAEDALTLAESEGLELTAVNALIALGSAAGNLGRGNWEERLIEATDRAGAINDVAAVGRSLNNRANCLRIQYGVGRSKPVYDVFSAHTDRFPLPFGVRWRDGTFSALVFFLGEWDAALTYAGRFDAAASGAGHYIDPQVSAIRGLIALGRGEPTDVPAAAMLARAREIGDFQILGTALTVGAWLLLAEGRRPQASELVGELLALPLGARRVAADFDTHVGWLGVDLEPALCDGLDDSCFSQRVCLAVFDGRLTEAIAELDEAEAATDAAYARLRLARRLVETGEDPEPWLSEAEAFYRRVGASRYLRELEALRPTRRSA